MPRWLKAIDRTELHSDFLKESDARTVRVDDQRYCIAFHEGKYFATQPNCPHANAALGDGWCDKEGNLVCPVHRIRFNLQTGKNTSGEGYFIKTYPTEVREDGLYIALPKRKWWQIF